MIALLGLVAAWQLTHLGGFAWDYDEGVHLMQARMLRNGYRLYTDIYTDQPPLLVSTLAAGFAIVGESVTGGRAMCVLYNLVGLGAVGWIAQRLRGGLAGACAVALLSVSPEILQHARVITGNLPAGSMAALAVAFALGYLWEGKVLLIPLAGTSFALSLLVKPTSAGAIVSLIVAVLGGNVVHGRARTWRASMVRSGPLVLSVVLVLVAGLVLHDWRGFSEQVVSQYRQARVVFPLDVQTNAQIVGGFLWENIGLLALAAYGCFVLPNDMRTGGALVGAWAAGELTLRLVHSPLWPGHLPPILLPLGVLSGVGLSSAIERGVEVLHGRRRFDWLTGVGLSMILLLVINLPELVRLDGQLLRAPVNEGEDEVVTLLAQVTDSGDYVITDNQMAAFRAGCLVPPGLCNTSIKRILTGNLTADQVIDASEAFQPRAVLLWSCCRLLRLEDYVMYVVKNYQLAYSAPLRPLPRGLYVREGVGE
ncbi:MAG: glycosyltransferase family 39 protein [Anaerolineae bacterium]|nr:glycosyltransferase family 39 protein [Anaerolineae bacterium]